jgi:hypothetical protein
VTPVRRSALVTAAALAVALLAGCGVQAGSASVVGSQSVRDSDVAAQVDEIRVAVGPDGAAKFDEKAATAATVNRLTRHLLLAEAATRQSITVTQAQVDDLIATTTKNQFGGDSAKFQQALAAQYLVPPSQINDFARDVLITQGLNAKLAPGGSAIEQSNKINAYLGPLSHELGIEVSPRFGSWSFAANTISDLPNDLAVPAVNPAGQPSPAPSAS